MRSIWRSGERHPELLREGALKTLRACGADRFVGDFKTAPMSTSPSARPESWRGRTRRVRPLVRLATHACAGQVSSCRISGGVLAHQCRGRRQGGLVWRQARHMPALAPESILRRGMQYQMRSFCLLTLGRRPCFASTRYAHIYGVGQLRASAIDSGNRSEDFYERGPTRSWEGLP